MSQVSSQQVLRRSLRAWHVSTNWMVLTVRRVDDATVFPPAHYGFWSLTCSETSRPTFGDSGIP